MKSPVEWRSAIVAIALVTSGCTASAAHRGTAGRTVYPTTVTTREGATVNEGVYAHTGPGALANAVRGDSSLVYVPNSGSSSVDVIDPNTLAVVDHFDTGRQPQHVTPAWDLHTLYVDNDQGNSLTPIDPRTGRPGSPIPVDDPYNLYFTPDGTKAIVVAERLRRLDFRDPITWALIKSVPVSHKGVDHADFTADGKTMLVSCEFSGWLVHVDVASMTVTGETDVGGQPIDVKLSPDGSRFFVANQQQGGVAVIDAVTFAQTGFISTGAGAHGLYPSRDGRSLYVSNRKAGTVSVIDFATATVADTWHVGGTPDMGGVSADGRLLWLSGRYESAVYVIDTRTGKRIKRIAVGKGPHGLCVFPQPGRFSLGHTGNFR